MRGTSPLPCPRVNSCPRLKPNPSVAGDETATSLHQISSSWRARRTASPRWEAASLR